nr:glycosyltransferase family 2 protein [Rhizobium cauense]
MNSLVKQIGPINEIRLYIPKRYRRFPEYDGSLPAVPDGITIVRPDEDMGPASKVLFAAREFRGKDVQILFCDDDKVFEPDWASTLFTAQKQRPNECVALIGKDVPSDFAQSTSFLPKAVRKRKLTLALRARRLRYKVAKKVFRDAGARRPMPTLIERGGYTDVLQGLGGVVVKPEFFDDLAYDIPKVLWAVDDYWLSGMLALKGIPIYLPAGLAEPFSTDATEVSSLFLATIEGADRVQANRRCIEYMQENFNIWR